jgi:hypothetical protein
MQNDMTNMTNMTHEIGLILGYPNTHCITVTPQPHSAQHSARQTLTSNCDASAAVPYELQAMP